MASQGRPPLHALLPDRKVLSAGFKSKLSAKPNDALLMTILALEFSSPQRSVAVLRGKDAVASASNEELDPPLPEGEGRGEGALRLGEPLGRDEGASQRATESPRLSGPASAAQISEVIETGGRGTAMIGMIENALRQARLEREQIECIAIGLGPGSYTGIRSAIAVAQGWELAAGKRAIQCIGLSSAAAIALQAHNDGLAGRISVVIDAQRNEFYVESYELKANGPYTLEPLRLASAADVEARQQAGDTLVGPEVTKWFPAGRLISPRAATLAQMARTATEFGSSRNLQPIYLRETRFVKAPPSRKLPLF